MTPVLRMETAAHSGSKGEKENWRKRRLLLLVWAGWAVHGLNQESGRKEEGKEEEAEEEEEEEACNDVLRRKLFCFGMCVF